MQLNSRTYPFELFLEDIFRNNYQRLFEFISLHFSGNREEFYQLYYYKNSKKAVKDPLPEYTTMSLNFLKVCHRFGNYPFSERLLFKMVIQVHQTNQDQSCFSFFCENWPIFIHEFVKIFNLLSPVQANIIWKHKETIISNFLEPVPSIDSHIRMIDFIKDQIKDFDLTLEQNQDKALFFCHLLYAHATNHASIPYDPFDILRKQTHQTDIKQLSLIAEYEEAFHAANDKQKKLQPNKYTKFIIKVGKTKKLCGENCQLEGISYMWSYKDQKCYDYYKCSICYTSFEIPTPTSSGYLLHEKKTTHNGYGYPLLFSQRTDDVERWS